MSRTAPSSWFALVDGERPRLEVAWPFGREVVARLDGAEIARMAPPAEDFVAFDVDGQRVIVRRAKQGLEARVGERILEGSPTHPDAEARALVRAAAIAVALQPACFAGVWLHSARAEGWPYSDNERVVAAALVALGVVSLVLAWRIVRADWATRDVRIATAAMLLAVGVQIVLGIATLVMRVPVSLAALHQAGAVILFAAALNLAHALRYQRRPDGAGIGAGSRAVTKRVADEPRSVSA